MTTLELFDPSTCSGPAPLQPEQERSIAEIWRAWNQAKGVTTFLALTLKRRTWFKQRLSEPFFRQNWKLAIDRIQKSHFCLGQNDRNWVANIDWFLRPNTCARIMEGLYDNRGGHPEDNMLRNAL